jgi:hypothetical protein
LLCDAAPSVSSFFAAPPEISATLDPSAWSLKTTTIRESFESPLDLLRDINARFDFTAVSSAFASRIHGEGACPFNSIGRHSIAMSILVHYPFLFPLHERLFAFKLVSLEPYVAFRTLAAELDALLYYKRSPLKLLVRRSSLFEDGLVLLDHRLSVEVRWAGEAGSAPARRASSGAPRFASSATKRRPATSASTRSASSRP